MRTVLVLVLFRVSNTNEIDRLEELVIFFVKSFRVNFKSLNLYILLYYIIII